MPPRGFTNPPPSTPSAREAIKSFYCTLCTKGYTRAPDYEAHLSSYDHSHRQRLKDMRNLSKDPMAGSKARKEEKRHAEKSGLISIKLGGEGEKKGGFRKSAFRSAFVEVGEGVKEEDLGGRREDLEGRKLVVDGGEEMESETDEEGGEVYDPRFPTD